MEGVQIKYSELCTVSVKQLFYDNQVCARYVVAPSPDMFIIPSAETVALMQRLGIVFRSTPATGGFILLVHTSGSLLGNALLRSPARKGDKLVFWVMLSNTSVLNFNELPGVYDNQKILYFSNEPAVPAPATVPPGMLRLTQLSSGVAAPGDEIKICTGVYRYSQVADITPGTAVLKHLLTGIEILPASQVKETGKTNLVFDLSTLPLGKCELRIGAALSPADTFFYTGFTSRKPFALIQLNLAGTVAPAHYRLTETNGTILPVRPQYEIVFPNRKTTWRYTIELTPGSALYKAILSAPAAAAFIANLKIESNDNTVVSFAAPVSAGAPVTRLTFLSTGVVALREKYVTTGLTLLKLTLKNGTDVFRDNLPFPDVGKLDASALPAVYSDVFITL